MIEHQFPEWSRLPIRPVPVGGWDNTSFRLGDDMVIRLPRADAYAAQAAKEQRYLPRLAPALPLPIPRPLAVGKPDAGYPWHWSVYSWIEGETAALESIADLGQFAIDLAGFLLSLQSIDPSEGPAPGPHNFHRGGSLAVYDAEVCQAIAILEQTIDVRGAARLWNAALRSRWTGAPVWVHGDIGPGNLLTRDGRLAAVIDFGALAVGDPACDLSIAWTFFSGRGRTQFLEGIGADSATCLRARGWTLWKALIVAARIAQTNAAEWKEPLRVIDDVLEQPVG